MKSTHVLGRSVARKRKPEEVFNEKEVEANQARFGELEDLLRLRSPDTPFREELVELIGQCRAFKSMWSDAPRRKLVHAELKALQTAFRRQPEKFQKHLSDLSPEGMLRLNLQGLNEGTSQGVQGRGGSDLSLPLAFLWVHELNATQKSHIPSPWLGTGVGQAAMDASSRP